MTTTSIVLIDDTNPHKPLSAVQIQQVGELIFRLDGVGIRYALGMVDDEPAFVLFYADTSTHPMGLAQTTRTVNRLEAVQ